MYFLKKLHKGPTAVRPIVSGCQGATERISELIDTILRPHVPMAKSYIKDTGHLIRVLENLDFPDCCTLATIDVRAMYTNIPHGEGVSAIINRLYTKNRNSDSMPIPPGTMSDLLKGARYSLIIHEVLVAMEFFSAGVQDETLKEESQRLAS